MTMSFHKESKSCVPTKEAEPEGMVIDGVYCRYLPLIIALPVFNKDCSDLKHFVIQSDDEDSSEDIRELPFEIDLERESPTDEFVSSGDKEYYTPVRTYRNHSSSSSRKIAKSKKRKYRRSESASTSVSDYSPFSSPNYQSKRYSKRLEGSEYVFGYYPCEVCKITQHSFENYKNHLRGKKHQKAVRAKEEANGKIRPFVRNDNDNSRYPKPPHGVYRKKIDDVSYIQRSIEKKFVTPCPGLEHVIEIRALKETSYYCELCDAACSVNCIISHLKGYKHMLQCLKLFKPSMYDQIIDEPKYKVERDVKATLRVIQKKEGFGRITVEKDYLNKETSKHEDDRSPKRMRMRASYEDMNVPFRDYYNATIVPDPSKSDFFCQEMFSLSSWYLHISRGQTVICEAHMNSVEMWESHIRGRRHLTNIKKNPGVRPSKVKSVRMPSAHCYLMEKLKEVNEPVVGLNHIKEVQNIETKMEMYNCYLCGGCLTSVDIIEHILSQKHRIKYLEEIRHSGIETLKIMDLSENSLYNLVEEMSSEVERKYGPGHPEVYILRNAALES